MAIRAIWATPPVHQWYQRRRPGGALSLQCSKYEQTSLSRLNSGYLRSLSYSNGSKTFPTCNMCCNTQATLHHILLYLGLDKQDLYSFSMLFLYFLRVNKIMNLTSF
ncbi:uncharacterized protein TNCV_2932651 [Trichonephila clavipes]|nr:uncharacterized protein TNCV_2932651 [Trichonephila clavipes]